jgi:signal transduction histidine kinase
MYIVDLDVDRFILGISILLVLEIFAIALGIAWYTLKEKKQIIDLLNERNSLQVESNLAQYHIRQNERRIIATDLHDDVLNRLSMLASLSTEGVITVKEIKSRLQQISEDIKSYTRSLYPIWIDKQPLEELLLDYFKSYAQSKGIQFGLNISKDVLTIPKMKKLQIFRIAQEFFQNSVKYGQPTEIHFELMRIEQDLLINLRDNGVGFDPNQMEKGIGMISLETRVKALRGEVEIFSRMGEGVRWKVKLPIQ